jgi:hypothetical protein
VERKAFEYVTARGGGNGTLGSVSSSSSFRLSLLDQLKIVERSVLGSLPYI